MTCGSLGYSLIRAAEGRVLSQRSLKSCATRQQGIFSRVPVRRTAVAAEKTQYAEPNVWPTNPGLSTMSDNGVVTTDKAPAPVGPYSQAIQAGDTLYVSGQVGLLPGESTISSEDVAGQAKQVLTNLGAILKAAGSGFDHVVKTTVLLTDMADFKAVNEVYATYFKETRSPARVCYAVKALPLNARVEIDAIAVR